MFQHCQFRWLWLLGLVIAALASGCGSDPTHQDHLQQILSNTNLSEAEKLEQMAKQIFNLTEFSLAAADPIGHNVTLTIRGNDDQVVRKIMEGKDAAALNKALKEFHLKTLNFQLADYLIRAQDMHLQQLTIALQVAEAGSQSSKTGGDVKYRLNLPKKNFAEFLTVAKLRPQEGLPKAEKLWEVVVDQFR
ncbi:MAG: hypothetical protein Q8M16_19755 [Pirellulaceae bacterium]|nr:hypothetical protein [Pirellulaceae bacterium]